MVNFTDGRRRLNPKSNFPVVKDGAFPNEYAAAIWPKVYRPVKHVTAGGLTPRGPLAGRVQVHVPVLPALPDDAPPRAVPVRAGVGVPPARRGRLHRIVDLPLLV